MLRKILLFPLYIYLYPIAKIADWSVNLDSPEIAPAIAGVLITTYLTTTLLLIVYGLVGIFF